MEGRALLVCANCGRRREVCGEFPDEYARSFKSAVDEGWVVKPGSQVELVCGSCLRTYEGHESVDDEEKIQGRKNPMEP